MSDQQDMSSDLGSTDGGPQQDQVQVEGLDSMRVRVTNIVDGFFRFASARSQSNLSSSGMSDSGRSSGRSSPASSLPRPSNSNSNSNLPTNTNSNTNASSSAPAPAPLRPKPVRRISSKRVKFKEDHPSPNSKPTQEEDEDNDTDTPDTNDSPSARPMEPLDAEFEAAKFYMDESSWGAHAQSSSRRKQDDRQRRRDSMSSRRDSDTSVNRPSRKRSQQQQQYRSSDKSISDDEAFSVDASTSSQASWNVHVTHQGDAEAVIRPVSSFEAAGVVRPVGSFENQLDGTATNDGPKWFEKYMPGWVISVRAFCGRIVLDDRFQIIMVLLISANAICMGIATFDFITDVPRRADLFERIDYIFLCIFTVELALQFGYWGYQVFTDGWLLFDFVTVMSSWLLDGVQVFRSFRVFRAFRLVVRIPILKSLVYAVLHVMPRISSIMGLFALLTYIYAVMATTLYKDFYELGYTGDEDYFGRLDYSLFTLFQFVTLEGWADIVRMVAVHDYFANIIFGSFLTISGFILYSLVVAVVCDSFLMVETQIRRELQQKAKEAREKRKTLKKRRGKRHLVDGDDETNFDASMSMALDESDLEMEDLDRRLTMERSRLSESRLGERPNQGELSSMDNSNKSWIDNSFIKRPDTKPEIPLAPGKKREPLIAHPSHLIQDEKNRRSQSPTPPTNKKGVPPPLSTPSYARPSPQTPAAPTKSRRPYASGLDPPQEEDEDRLLTETTSATAATNARTLAIGELERKKHQARNRKKKPVRHRIRRVQKRLDKLTAAQSEILCTLDEMCKEMERRNGILDDE